MKVKSIAECSKGTLSKDRKLVFKTSYCLMLVKSIAEFSKGTVTGNSQKERKLVFKTNYRLMQVKSITECFLQYFRPSLSYHLPLRSLFCLFLSGGFTQVLLYVTLILLTLFGATSLYGVQWLSCRVAMVREKILEKEKKSRPESQRISFSVREI